MLTIAQIEKLITSVAHKTAKASVISQIASVINSHQLLFKHGEKEIRVFIGMAGHETGGFRYFAEIGSEDYFQKMYGHKTPKGKELGNTEPTDGSRFRGRGMLHLTGRNNYRLYAQRIGKEDLIMNTPEVVTTNMQIATETSIAYWMERVQPYLVFLCDEEENLFVKATHGINPGELPRKPKSQSELNKMKEADRNKYLEKVKKLANLLAHRREKVMSALHFELPTAVKEELSLTASIDDTLLMPSLNDGLYRKPFCEMPRIELVHEESWWTGTRAISTLAMQILIIRIKKNTTRVLGELYVDGDFVCYTLESVPLSGVLSVPAGQYNGIWLNKNHQWYIDLMPVYSGPALKICIGKSHNVPGSIGVGYIGKDNLINPDVAIKKLREGYFRGNETIPKFEKPIEVKINEEF